MTALLLSDTVEENTGTSDTPFLNLTTESRSTRTALYTRAHVLSDSPLSPAWFLMKRPMLLSSLFPVAVVYSWYVSDFVFAVLQFECDVPKC